MSGPVLCSNRPPANGQSRNGDRCGVGRNRSGARIGVSTLSSTLMGFVRNRLSRRFSSLGLVSDLALVGAAMGRAFQRKNGVATSKASGTELVLAGGAAFRLLQRLRRNRKARKARKLAG